MKIEAQLFLVGVLLSVNVGAQNTCNERRYNYDSFVCVCDGSSCDYYDNPGPAPSGSFQKIQSSRDSNRFLGSTVSLSSSMQGDNQLYVARSFEYQSMLGFGGAFTDSTGLNIRTLSQAAQDAIIRSYFADDGIRYNLCRIPIAGSDFSTYPYSYDDWAGDITLSNFSLTYEDYNYKLPYIHQAIDASSDEILLFGSPWAPPAWMKTNQMVNGSGILMPQYWDLYAQYLVKFVDSYEANNLTIWGITPQNEPGSGFEDWAWNTCGWTAEDMRDWIKQSFGPIFSDAAGYRRVKLMVHDFNRDGVPAFPQTVLEDPIANQYVDGVAVHWYSDNYVDSDVLSTLQLEFPDKYILYTEGCEGWYSDDATSVQLGSWQRGENYAYDFIDNLNHFATGWVDWNMALDTAGGPNWAGNLVDAPIIINAASDEFYKQPTYYAMGHFSKFVKRGAARLLTSFEGSSIDGLYAVAFNNQDNTDVIVILNTNEAAVTLNVGTFGTEYAILDLEAKSLETIILNRS